VECDITIDRCNYGLSILYSLYIIIKACDCTLLTPTPHHIVNSFSSPSHHPVTSFSLPSHQLLIPAQPLLTIFSPPRHLLTSFSSQCSVLQPEGARDRQGRERRNSEAIDAIFEQQERELAIVAAE
jgi:hypothetical protein